jgi:hypothetical protein
MDAPFLRSAGARDHLWEAFFPFAVTECRKQAELMNLEPDIAEGEAALAIPKAIERFDLRKSTGTILYFLNGGTPEFLSGDSMGVTHLRLTIVPNKSGSGTATLTALRLFV